MVKDSNSNKIPLASIQWLKYLGIVFVILSAYIVGQCYYHYSDDIFSKSLTIGQHIKLSILSIGSMLSELLYPVFFFSGALIYSAVRLKNISPLNALKRDLFVIIPLGITLWFYGAFGQEPVKSGFHMMIYEIQDLEPGEKLIQDPELAELFESPDLIGLYNKIDTLNIQINEAENRLRAKGQLGMEQYIKELKSQQARYNDEVMVIHFSPVYLILFLVFGLLLGFLIPLHKAALTAILIVIGLFWYYGISVLVSVFDPYHANQFICTLGKIGLLLLLNTTLLIVSIKVYQRSKEIYL